MNADQSLCQAFEKLAKAVNPALDGTRAPSNNPQVGKIHWINALADAPHWKTCHEHAEAAEPKPKAKPAVKPKPKK